jgi:pimeloyl-ACP methyl ester carboxylesterase
MMRRMTAFFATLLITYLAACLLLYVSQRRLLFFPVTEVDLPGTKSRFVDTGDAVIKVWVVNPGRAKALIYFGGNAENVAYDVDAFSARFRERTLYLVNYRGYGGSSGTPDEAGLYRDALALYDRFAPAHESMAVIGRSIGSAVATELASKRETEKLVLITPFDSGTSVAQKLYPFFPMGLIVRDRYDSVARAEKITAPVLIIAAGSDEIIPQENTRNLARSFPKDQLRFELLPETGHNTLQLHPDYDRLLSEFINR